jgi:hypothetical protein
MHLLISGFAANLRRLAMNVLNTWRVKSVRTFLFLLPFLLCFALILGSQAFSHAAQTTMDVRPDLTPRVVKVTPNQVAAGGEATITISGENFARGAYVSFSAPVVHVKSTEWISSNELVVDLAVNRAAQAGAVKLYVSNPASSAAEAPFTIVAATSASTASAPVPAAATTTGESQPSNARAPEVKSVDPARAKAGTQLDLKIKGKNFAEGAKVAFSNPGIVVTETRTVKSSELQAHLQVAADAPGGATSLYVVNPDDAEVEVPFEVVNDAPSSTATAPAPAPAEPAKTSSKSTAGATDQRFEVYSLGEGVNILQILNMPKGTLVAGSGRLRYEENGKEVFSVKRTEIKEIGPTMMAGFNTGIFQVILNSGKTYHFAATSLRPADSASIIDALRGALQLSP